MRRKLDMDKPMEVVFTNGIYGLYEDCRYEPAEGFFRYECREGERYYFCTIENRVIVNFSGTVFTKQPLDPSRAIYEGTWEGFDISKSDGFCGFAMTPEDFLKATDEELEYARCLEGPVVHA